jgi:hypothetical protein
LRIEVDDAWSRRRGFRHRNGVVRSPDMEELRRRQASTRPGVERPSRLQRLDARTIQSSAVPCLA